MWNARRGACVELELATGLPECKALKSLQDVLSWTGDKEQVLRSVNSRGYRRPTQTRTKPYTLVCHDFKGGYLEDRYLQGGKKTDAYIFSRWELIDIFVYFSHHFVTVPPHGWTRACHKHSTLMLGTIITEWEDGERLWATVLSSRDLLLQLVSSLVAICAFHGFDGWLVNVENKIDKPHVEALTEFVMLLANQMHQELPGSKVLWYDSVISTGELKWQDELNENNCQFFDVCDGIFLNYCWTPNKLAASKDHAVKNGRPYDVFVGIDVFGRGCRGGGGFNTREALECTREQGLSAALFAPGWVLETLGAASFEDNDINFWSRLKDLCYENSNSSLSLSSAFCRGLGKDFFCMGRSLKAQSWFNVGLQQCQPRLVCDKDFLDQQKESVVAAPYCKPCYSSAYYGGCSLELSAFLTSPLQTTSFKLFSGTAQIDKENAVFCSYTFKDNSSLACDVYLVLRLGSGSLARHFVMGCSEFRAPYMKNIISTVNNEGDESPDTETALWEAQNDTEHLSKAKGKVSPEAFYICPLTTEQLEPLKTSIWFHDLQENETVWGDNGWKTRHFKIDISLCADYAEVREDWPFTLSVSLCRPARGALPDQHPTGSGRAISETERCSVLIGHLQVFRQQDLGLQVPVVKNLRLDWLETLGLWDISAQEGTTLDTLAQEGTTVDMAQEGTEADTLAQKGTTVDTLAQEGTTVDTAQEGTEDDTSAQEGIKAEATYRFSKEAAEFSQSPCVLSWNVEGSADVDYFNIYFTSSHFESPCLKGHSVVPTFVTDISSNFVHQGAVTVIVQPVLSSLGLPLPLSKCTRATIPLPTMPSA